MKLNQNIPSPLSEAEISDIEAEISHLPDRKSAAIDALKIVQSASDVKRGIGWDCNVL